MLSAADMEALQLAAQNGISFLEKIRLKAFKIGL